MIFDAVTNIAIKDNGIKPGMQPSKTYHAVHLAGDALIGLGAIMAFRELNMIGKLGTAFLAFGTTIEALDNLQKWKNA
jgi:hypothetical protein